MTDFNHAPVCQPEPAIFDSSWNNANVPSQYRNVKREVYLRVFYLICIWHCFVSHYLKKNARVTAIGARVTNTGLSINLGPDIHCLIEINVE